jgi:hypothetical protein
LHAEQAAAGHGPVDDCAAHAHDQQGPQGADIDMHEAETVDRHHHTHRYQDSADQRSVRRAGVEQLDGPEQDERRRPERHCAMEVENVEVIEQEQKAHADHEQTDDHLARHTAGGASISHFQTPRSRQNGS